jgi:hypothetical protein
MTRTTFLRLTILQSSHRRLTEALTFMVGWFLKSGVPSEDKKSRWHWRLWGHRGLFEGLEVAALWPRLEATKRPVTADPARHGLKIQLTFA